MEKIEEYFGTSLPEAYKNFLIHNTDYLQNDLVATYLLEGIIERNTVYETKEYAPGYIAIGDDSGGSAFLLKLKETNSPVYSVDHGSMDPLDMELVSNSFTEWQESSFEYK